MKNWIEFWFARDLQHLLWYTKWDNFLNVISKAKTAVETSNQNLDNHFADVRKMVFIGSWAKKEMQKLLLIDLKIKKLFLQMKMININF